MAGTISVALVVNNEDRQLRECLNAVKELADELCIVDTGSTDETLAVAREYDANISVFIWCDDRAAVRNEAIRLCSKDWIFMLDADERVDPASISEIRALTNSGPDRCFKMPMRSYTNSTTVSGFTPCESNDPHAKGFAGWYSDERIRLWPRGPGAKFEGTVDESIAPAIERLGLKVISSDILVYHYPFLHETSDSGNGENGGGAPAPNGNDDYFELGNQYAQTGDFANAAKAYKMALKKSGSEPGVLRNLGTVLHALGRDDEAKHALRVALELNPEMAEAWYQLGMVYLDGQEWKASLECFERAQKHNPDWKEGARCISMALEGMERFKEAADYARKAFETLPTSPECLRLFIHQMLRLERRAEAREIILNAIENGARKPDLHNALGELFFYDKQYDEARHHFRKAGSMGFAGAYNNLGVVDFQLKRRDAARQAFEKCLELDPGHRGAQRNLEKVLRAAGES